MLIALPVSCGDDEPESPASLPFGLEEVNGTERIGTPAFFDHEPYTFDGEPVQMRSLIAVYRVTADNPGEVFLDWVEQLDKLAIDEVSVRAGSAAYEPWLQAESVNPFTPEGPPPDVAHLRLWATDDEPILSVEIDRAGAAPDPGRIRITGDRGRLPSPPSVAGEDDREAGDLLFEEQRDEIHLPDDSNTDVPTLPRHAGTGGTFSVFLADDGAAAVDALLAEARSLSDGEEVTGPDESELEGTDIITASFNIPAGGWGFDVVAVRAPDDDRATVYVTTYAD